LFARAYNPVANKKPTTGRDRSPSYQFPDMAS
jgi:hypothetical protein